MTRSGSGLRRVVAATLLIDVALAAPARAQPSVSAPQAILLEPVTGNVLFERESARERPIASATKLMTALVVLERAALEDEYTAPAYEPISPAETRLGLRPGERMAVGDLLRALLLASSNDAAQALAVGTAGSTVEFVELMNRRARELGLRDTHYSNPIGLDDAGNYSSAADLAALTAHLRRYPFFRRTVALPRARLHSGEKARVVENRNDLVGIRPYVDGVKTGHTLGAGYVLVGSATRRGVTVISVVLGDPSEAARDADTVALLDHGLGQLHAARLLRARQRVASARVRHAPDERVALVAPRGVTRILRRGQRARLRLRAPAELEGPLPAGAPVGTAVVTVDGRTVERIPLVTAGRVRRVGWVERGVDRILRPGTLAVIAASVALAAVAITVRRRRRAPAEGRSQTA